jgi:hypothetical protein
MVAKLSLRRKGRKSATARKEWVVSETTDELGEDHVSGELGNVGSRSHSDTDAVRFEQGRISRGGKRRRRVRMGNLLSLGESGSIVDTISSLRKHEKSQPLAEQEKGAKKRSSPLTIATTRPKDCSRSTSSLLCVGSVRLKREAFWTATSFSSCERPSNSRPV